MDFFYEIKFYKKCLINIYCLKSRNRNIEIFLKSYKNLKINTIIINIYKIKLEFFMIRNLLKFIIWLVKKIQITIFNIEWIIELFK